MVLELVLIRATRSKKSKMRWLEEVILSDLAVQEVEGKLVEVNGQTLWTGLYERVNFFEIQAMKSQEYALINREPKEFILVYIYKPLLCNP